MLDNPNLLLRKMQEKPDQSLALTADGRAVFGEIMGQPVTVRAFLTLLGNHLLERYVGQRWLLNEDAMRRDPDARLKKPRPRD